MFSGGYGGAGGFAGAEHSRMMFADMDEDDLDEDDYGTDEYDDEDEEISATDSELLAMEQYRRQQAAAQAKAQSMAYSGPGSKPLGSSLYGGVGSMGGAGAFSSGGGT